MRKPPIRRALRCLDILDEALAKFNAKQDLTLALTPLTLACPS